MLGWFSVYAEKFFLRVELVGKSWVRWNSVASFVICVLESWATEGSSADEQIDGAVDVILY